jgi:histidinol dehydrogenase
MRIIDAGNARAIEALFAKKETTDRAFERKVASIVQKVRTGGDKALLRFARQFDNLAQPVEVTRAEMEAEAAIISSETRQAIKNAARNIARVAAHQIPKHFDVDVVPGVQVEQRVEPLESVGCYVPGGRFPLPSSLLMTAVPARVAGVRHIVAVCPRPDGSVMAAALEAGVTKLFRIGGAHAVAALAYGTASIPRVDKIVGPGNKWVAQAKALVSADCAIDFYAGPTEIVVVAASGDPKWVAADLIAQAEHDPDARSVLITWKKTFAERVSRVVDRIAKGREIVTKSLSVHGAIVIAKNPDEAMQLSNRFAPEHLVVESDALINRPIVAGAVFVGPYTAQAAGDYATGSNHVLPTAGAARFRGGLSAADFVRVMAVQRLTADGLARLAPTIVSLARAEGLRAHAESIQVRL